MEKVDVFVSVVAPLHNHGAVVADFVKDVYDLLDSHYANYEIVLIDDASQDDTIEQIRRVLRGFRCVRVLRLSREMGAELALLAGLESAIGDYVVTMDANSDPPAEIIPMVELSRAGNDLVVGVADTT
jgi:glycosyltransferase involved in cell wall biosynthesis